ncbi:MAG: NYN domain-containing protein [Chloroflexi bacterium]|nr:NYN domain-containing protein [Chloroflexota bacterium]
MTTTSPKKHIALLIDADNIGLAYIKQILKLCEVYGQLKVCRAYGDWKQAPLAASCEKIDMLKIERRQVDRVGKNATDHHLLIEAGELLGADSAKNKVDIFMIVSGDGDFTSLSKLIKERGKQVIGISNKKQASDTLRKSCTKFYFLEELASILNKPKPSDSMSADEKREFLYLLFYAYHQLTSQNDWVTYSQIEKKLHELAPDYDRKFGKHKLSKWLKSVDQEFESADQKIRRIDPNPENTRLHLILDAYIQAKQSDGLAHIGQLGQALRTLDPDYKSHFGTKRLSTWLKAYPDKFKTQGDYVRLAK